MAELLTIDSSVFVASLNSSDPFSEISEQFFQRLASLTFEILLPTLIVCEVANVLTRLGQHTRLPKILSYFESFTWMSLDSEETSASIKLFQKFNLKTSDAIVATVAYRYGATLITWDEGLLREAGKHLSAYKPSSFLTKLAQS